MAENDDPDAEGDVDVNFARLKYFEAQLEDISYNFRETTRTWKTLSSAVYVMFDKFIQAQCPDLDLIDVSHDGRYLVYIVELETTVARFFVYL